MPCLLGRIEGIQVANQGPVLPAVGRQVARPRVLSHSPRRSIVPDLVPGHSRPELRGQDRTVGCARPSLRLWIVRTVPDARTAIVTGAAHAGNEVNMLMAMNTGTARATQQFQVRRTATVPARML
jgi:hypothetical protein